MALGTLEEITLDWEGTDNVGEVVALAALETPKWSREEFGSGACDCDRGLPTNPTESLLKYVGKAGTNAGTGSGDRGRWSNRKLQWPLEFTSGAGAEEGLGLADLRGLQKVKCNNNQGCLPVT
ncbi:hypothetical protein OUZ56_032694 [Daphnia magna]|uniref:Uncharacterized protein n=1 Tax=Daphnia magna TaxID=35525 RepID=A0ABQ9ZWV1_9CRUS|nr:hypothetical protein OUZ56_032694 [Daphnia magna]